MNNVKTFMLMGGLMALFLLAGQLIGGTNGLVMTPVPNVLTTRSTHSPVSLGSSGVGNEVTLSNRSGSPRRLRAAPKAWV